MLIADDIHGRAEIDEPVLLDLLAAPALQRLHGILQHGISGLIGLTPPITRYEHSVGVMLLVRRLGAPLTEQIAALLHDVSHTAFSHVMDHVFDSPDSQSFHERVKEGFLQRTGLPEILANHGYDWQAFLDEAPYGLLEQPAPALCADRIDYFLRDAAGFRLARPEQISAVLNHLVVRDGRLVLDDLAVARWMADTFIRADDHSWSNFKEVGLYELTARALRRAFEAGILQADDIWLTDAALWEKMNEASDPQLQKMNRLIRPDVRFAWDAEAPTFVLSTKIRTIDPDVIHDGRVQPLSAWDPSFANRREAYLRRKEGPWPMKLEE